MEDKELTKKKFVGGEFYTGDFGKLGADGNFYYVGRNDRMIKINGNRIELAEVESVVKKHGTYPAEGLHEDAYEMTVHYLGKMLDIVNSETVSWMLEECEKLYGEDEGNAKIITEVVLFEENEEIYADIYYNSGRYRPESIKKYADLYVDICQRYLISRFHTSW